MKHIKMPKELAAKWLDALRSGKYKQARGKLHCRKDNSFCCLGVLQNCISGHTVKTNDGEELPAMEWLHKYGITFLGRIDEKTTNPWILSQGDTVANLNDNRVPFEGIANLLEEEIEFTDEDTVK